jgi:hypothetical protein
MTIKIYYAYYDTVWGQEPVSILKKHWSDKNKEEWAYDFKSCPSVKNFYHNMYGIPALRDYHLNISKTQTYSKLLNQAYYDREVKVTNQDKRSIQYGKIFLFTEQKNLLVTVSYPPFLEKTIQHANYITGQLDVGKYPRAMQASIQFLHDTDWNIRKDDLLWYIKFHTKEKIKFIPFRLTEKMMILYAHAPRIKTIQDRKRPFTSLIPFYTAIKNAGIKKLLLKEIKQNLSGDYA